MSIALKVQPIEETKTVKTIIVRVRPETVGFFKITLPDEARVTEFQISPVRQIDGDSAEYIPTTPKKAEMYSVFAKDSQGATHLIADLPDQELAEAFAASIRSLAPCLAGLPVSVCFGAD